MELRHLRTALAVLRHGTVSDIAVALATAPSSVSQRIRELEAELDAELFARTGRGMRPARHGEEFLARVATALEYLDDATDEIRRRRVPVQLGALQGIVAGPLQPLLDEVTSQHPELELRVHPEPDRAVLLRMLQAGEIDVALMLDTGNSLGELGFELPAGTFDFLDLREVELHAVCGPQHPLRGSTLTPKVLRHSGELIGQEERCSYWLATRSWLGPQTTVTAVGGLPQVREWVLAGRGIAVLPDFAISADLTEQRLCPLELTVPPLRLRMVWRTAMTENPAQRRLTYALSQL